MIICSCNVISDHAIRAVVDRTLGMSHPAHEIYRSVGYVPDCGRCARSVKQVIKHALGEALDASRAACGGLEQPNMVPDILASDIHAADGFEAFEQMDTDLASANVGSCGPDCCRNRRPMDESLPDLGFGTDLTLGGASRALAEAAE